MEKALKKWLREVRASNIPVSFQKLREKGIALAQPFKDLPSKNRSKNFEIATNYDIFMTSLIAIKLNFIFDMMPNKAVSLKGGACNGSKKKNKRDLQLYFAVQQIVLKNNPI